MLKLGALCSNISNDLNFFGINLVCQSLKMISGFVFEEKKPNKPLKNPKYLEI